MKTLVTLLLLISLYGCIVKEQTESTELTTTPTQQAYYSATEMNLPPGKIIEFAYTNEYVEEMCAETSFDQKPIPVKILDSTGIIRIGECDCKTWYLLHPGDILK